MVFWFSVLSRAHFSVMLRTIIRQPVHLRRIRRPCRRLFFTFDPSETFMSTLLDQGSIRDWMRSNRLYEDNLFYYLLIIAGWFVAGFLTLGFEWGGFSPAQNLALNFVWYLLLCTGMALAPVWYRLLFGRTHTAQREQAVRQVLDGLEDEAERQMFLRYLAAGGQLPMRSAQRWALVFLGGYFLFEVFFITAWVKDMALVWQPDWVLAIVEWVKGHTNLPPMNEGWDVFDLSIERKDFIYQYYQSNEDFMASELGMATMLFSFLRLFAYPLIVVALMKSFGIALGWLGTSQIAYRSQTSLWGFIWATALMLGTFLMTISSILMVQTISDDTKIAPIMFGRWVWLAQFYMNLIYFFVVMSVVMLLGWLRLVFSFFFNLVGKVLNYGR